MKQSDEFAELFPSLYAHFCRRWTPGDYRPSGEATAILEHLVDVGPLTVTEAARHFDRSQAATSELIDRLRERGLIERIRDERDQRKHLVWLTPEGRALVAELRRVLDPDLLDPAFERLTPKKDPRIHVHDAGVAEPPDAEETPRLAAVRHAL